MANSPQAKKRARQNASSFAKKKLRRSRFRNYLRSVESAIATGVKEAAQQTLKAAQPELMRGVTKGVYHKNTAARKMSRLAARVKAVGENLFASRLKARPAWARFFFGVLHASTGFPVISKGPEILLGQSQSQARCFVDGGPNPLLA